MNARDLLLVALSGWDAQTWVDRSSARASCRTVMSFLPPASSFDRREVAFYAVTWERHPPGSLAGLPNFLPRSFSLGTFPAFCDHLLWAIDRLPDVPVSRGVIVVDQDLTGRNERICFLMHCADASAPASRLHGADSAAASGRLTAPSPRPHEVRVGGDGSQRVLGNRMPHAKLRMMGFDDGCGPRSPKEYRRFPTFAGEAGLDAFLGAPTFSRGALTADRCDGRAILELRTPLEASRDGRSAAAVVINRRTRRGCRTTRYS